VHLLSRSRLRSGVRSVRVESRPRTCGHPQFTAPTTSVTTLRSGSTRSPSVGSDIDRRSAVSGRTDVRPVEDRVGSPHATPPRHLQSLMLRMISWYQRLAEGRPSPCRFYPTCSAYAHESISIFGARRGLWLTVRRLVRCRPFGPSGFDPVPLQHVHLDPSNLQPNLQYGEKA
jgi:uncharacterized protein